MCKYAHLQLHVLLYLKKVTYLCPNNNNLWRSGCALRDAKNIISQLEDTASTVFCPVYCTCYVEISQLIHRYGSSESYTIAIISLRRVMFVQFKFRLYSGLWSVLNKGSHWITITAFSLLFALQRGLCNLNVMETKKNRSKSSGSI